LTAEIVNITHQTIDHAILWCYLRTSNATNIGYYFDAMPIHGSRWLM
jgi:hypothetical protein